MKTYDDIEVTTVHFYIKLIMRYIHDYSKLIFLVEKSKSNPNFIFLTQLLSTLSTSEECYQVVLMIMELKLKLETNDKTTLMDRVSL